jgi:hypothetical protein
MQTQALDKTRISGFDFLKSLPLVVVLLFFMANPFEIYAQQNDDSLYTSNVVEDPVLDTMSTVHSPKKAGWMSAALPGLGQIYNKKYWKTPVIYVAFGTITYFLVNHNSTYQDYREAYIRRTDDDPTNDDIYPQYTVENLRVLKDIYWKRRDFDIILIALLYTLNVLDAVVDAHFFTYDISEDLSLHIDPVLKPNFGFTSMGSTAGLSLSISF